MDLTQSRRGRGRRLRRDVATYRRVPQTPAEIELALVDPVPLPDPMDWEALYADDRA